MVEPLSPMALPRRASGGVFGSTAVSPKHPTSRLTPQEGRLGTIDLHESDHFFTYQNRDTNRTCCYIQSADEKPPSAVFDFSRMHTDMMISLVFRRFHPRSPVHAGKT